MDPMHLFDVGSHILDDFDAATVGRGRQYADEGRVRDLAWHGDGDTLTGMCAGSGGRSYRVELYFESVGADRELVWAGCGCPVGRYCKHAVALLLTAAAHGRLGVPRQRWRTVFGGVLDELGAAVAEGSAAIGLEFSVKTATVYRPVPVLALRPVTLGKRGTWVKKGLTWRQILFGTDAGGFDQRQYLAIRALATDVHRVSPAMVGDVIMIAGAPRTVWSQLTAVIDAGVGIVADRASGLQAVELIKTAQLRLDFTADAEGGAAMTPKLIIDGEQCDTGQVGLLGAPVHGVSHIDGGVLRLGPFDPVPATAMLRLAARGEGVHIPAEDFAEFSLTVLPRLARVAPLEIAEGLFTPPRVSGPVPVLTIAMTGTGARASWSIRYGLDDRHHDFEPDTPPALTGYRDIDAEEAAWRRAEPVLRAVAAAAHTWKHQAVQHIARRMRRTLNAAIFDEHRAISAAADAAAAAAVATRATLCDPVDLTRAEAAVLCGEILPQLDCLHEVAVDIGEGTPDFRVAQRPAQLEFGTGDDGQLGNDWFDLNVTVRVDGQPVPLRDVFVELSSGATHMLLPSGVYFPLDTPELLRLRELIEEARALGEIEGDRVNARSMNVSLWEELLALGVVDEQVAQWRDNLARLSSAQPPAPVDPPAGLRAVLRDYQRDGLNWLSFLWDNGIGGVLADDMGLGKTLQTLALIARAAEAGAGRFLVVAPASVVSNWAAECRRFAPGLEVLAVTSTAARSGLPLAEQTAAADIVVTSYTLMRLDFDVYAEIDWAGVIFDEAQFVKNHNSATHRCARRLPAPFKLAITGTPMENNLMELWSLLSITAPGLFPSPTAFADYFRKPIESGSGVDRLPVLRRRIKPVMLRRTKAQVASELPPKHEQVLNIDLGAKHRKIYDTRLARERQKVLGLLGDWEKNRFRIFRSLTLLRQLSLHAGLVDAAHANVASAKVDYLAERLPELISEGHSALVFSQFTAFLGIIRSHLDTLGIAYSYLDGAMSAPQRAAAVAEFQRGATQVFLISLKAGGFGLNLTEADYCFVCDPWWSPAAEAQAVDRAHRIGQNRPVSVYRLVSQGTIEERVVHLQERKRALFTAVVDEGGMLGSAITASDIRALLG